MVVLNENNFIFTLKVIINLLFGLPLSLSTPLYFSWVLTVLWGWYIIPVFHLDPISIYQGFGLVITIGAIAIWLRLPSIVKNKKKEENDGESFTWGFWKEIIVYYSVISFVYASAWFWHWLAAFQ